VHQWVGLDGVVNADGQHIIAHLFVNQQLHQQHAHLHDVYLHYALKEGIDTFVWSRDVTIGLLTCTWYIVRAEHLERDELMMMGERPLKRATFLTHHKLHHYLLRAVLMCLFWCIGASPLSNCSHSRSPSPLPAHNLADSPHRFVTSFASFFSVVVLCITMCTRLFKTRQLKSIFMNS
jgi:hypothetical protein